jgi:hypothetical protein
MAHEAKLSTNVRAAVAGATIQEGRIVNLTVSGVREDLPTAVLAVSGTRFNTYVAFVPPDNFGRPTPGTLYGSVRTGTLYESSAWGNFTETDTFYRTGLSTLENPYLVSGYGLLAKAGGIYTVPSGCVVVSSNLKVVGNLAKVADDGTGRFEYTTTDSLALAKVVDYDPATESYTFEFRI